MSGVIDSNGQQWERCNVCAEFVRFEDLHYEEPSDRFKYGRDLCSTCAELTPDEQDAVGKEATERWRTEQLEHYRSKGWTVEVTADGGIRILDIPDKDRWQS